MPELDSHGLKARETAAKPQRTASIGHAGAAVRPERRMERRHKGPRQVWIQCTDSSGAKFEEIQIMQDYSRGGFYFVSSLPCYALGTRLNVIPSFGSLNLEFVAEVVRVEPKPRMSYGVAVKLLHAREPIAPQNGATA